MERGGSKLTQVGDWFLDWILPDYCAGCGKIGVPLCENCGNLLKFNVRNIGLTDGELTTNVLKNLYVVFDSTGGVAHKIVKAIKYHFRLGLLSELESAINSYLKNVVTWDSCYLLVPVPLHQKKYRQRGFNQSAMICQLIQKQFGNIIIDKMLVRKINNKPQVRFNASARQANIKNIFQVNPDFLTDKILTDQIVLVDDVYTTGATMQEAAQTLKKYGFKNISGLVLVRG